jgi:hypothetical protein
VGAGQNNKISKEIPRTNLETFEEEEEIITIIIINIISAHHHQQTKIFFQVTYRVDWLITDRLPTIEHLFISSSYVFHFE